MLVALRNRSRYGEEYELDAPVRLVHHLQTGEREKPGQQVVLVSQILASQLTIGYTELKNIQVPKLCSCLCSLLIYRQLCGDV